MARPIKQGLDYFPLDVSIFNDRKIRRLLKSQGSCSMSVFICLLCHIYAERGYFIECDEDLYFDMADELGLEVIDVKNVVIDSVNYGLFDKQLFEGQNILTSEAIQRRFKSSTLKRRERVINSNYWIIDGNNLVNDGNNPVQGELLTSIVHKSNQIKEKPPIVPLKGDRGKTSSKKFIIPTLEEVTTYCRDRNNIVDPNNFIDHYTANGWMVGKNKMKDWKAAVRTWERSNKHESKNKQTEEGPQYGKL